MNERFQETTSEEMDDAIAGEEPVGHVCLFFLDHEIHCDLHGDIEDFALFAQGVGEFITMVMLKQLMETPSCRH